MQRVSVAMICALHGQWEGSLRCPRCVAVESRADRYSLIERCIIELLGATKGENEHREGLRETPARFAKAWMKWTEGYGMQPEDVLKAFEDGGEKCDEMVVQRNIPFYSHCEHHLAPFFGMVSIAYLPNGRIVGLSKLSRLVDVFAHRLQVQERLTTQVADALALHLAPLGVGVVVEARHLCMESRGIQRIGALTSTSALRGLIKKDASARAEFFSLVKP